MRTREHLTLTYLDSLATLRRFLSLALRVVSIGMWVVCLHYGARSIAETTVVQLPSLAASTAADGDRVTHGDLLGSASTAVLPWSIHFHAVPGTDGSSLFVSTGQTADLYQNTSADLDVGGGRRRWAMAYSTENTAYEVTMPDALSPGPAIVEGKLALSSELDGGDTLDTGDISFRRFYVPTTGAAPIVSGDNNLEMILSDNSLSVDAYVVVMSTNAIPGPIPAGHQLVGQSYSVRPSGAVVTSTKPILLKFFYDDTALGDVDPHTLSILEWDPVAKEWSDLGGDVHDWIDNSVIATTDRFTVYALMSAPRWEDAFNDITGLSEWSHVTVLPLSSELVLDGTAYTGTATSRAITPTVPIDEWGSIYYSGTIPSGTSLTVDVLSADGVELLGDVASGTSLSTMDPAAYACIRLRAAFTTDDLAESASVEEWTVTWEPRSYEVHLPIVLRR